MLADEPAFQVVYLGAGNVGFIPIDGGGNEEPLHIFPMADAIVTDLRPCLGHTEGHGVIAPFLDVNVNLVVDPFRCLVALRLFQ